MLRGLPNPLDVQSSAGARPTAREGARTGSQAPGVRVPSFTHSPCTGQRRQEPEAQGPGRCSSSLRPTWKHSASDELRSKPPDQRVFPFFFSAKLEFSLSSVCLITSQLQTSDSSPSLHEG